MIRVTSPRLADKSNSPKIEEGLGPVFKGEQLLNLGPRGLLSTTVNQDEECLLGRNFKVYGTMVKADWLGGSAPRGDL